MYVFIYPFTISAVLHSSGTFVSGKMTISGGNRDVISTFYCSTTSFYGKGYYYHSQMSRRNAGLQLWWKDLLLLVWRIIAFHFVIIVYFFKVKPLFFREELFYIHVMLYLLKYNLMIKYWSLTLLCDQFYDVEVII